MTCKDCIHYDMCLEAFRESKAEGLYELIDEEEYFAHADECDFFIDKSRYIELPVKVGDYVYYIKGGYYRKPSLCEVSRPCKVVEVSFKLQRSGSSVMSGFITDNGTRYSFNGIGKTVFLTREEAEKALAERNGNGM